MASPIEDDGDVTSTHQPTAAAAAAGKTKRDDQGPVVAAAEVVDELPPSAAALRQRAGGVPSSPSRQVAFASTVHHRVTAFITWTSYPSCRRRSDAGDSAVTGYRLRYGHVASSTPITQLELDSNVAVIDDLQASAEYWYQLRHVLDDGTYSPWTDKQLLQT